MNNQEGFAIAVEEAKIGYKEGGVPVKHPKPITQYTSDPDIHSYQRSEQL